MERNIKHALELDISPSTATISMYNCSLLPLVRHNLPDALSSNPSWKGTKHRKLQLNSCCSGAVFIYLFIYFSTAAMLKQQHMKVLFSIGKANIFAFSTSTYHCWDPKQFSNEMRPAHSSALFWNLQVQLETTSLCT